MSYNYAEQRSNIFTESGQIMFLKVRDNAQRLLSAAGAVSLGALVEGLTGDSWDMLACVDRLVEIEELHEIPNPYSSWSQDRVFVKRISS